MLRHKQPSDIKSLSKFHKRALNLIATHPIIGRASITVNVFQFFRETSENSTMKRLKTAQKTFKFEFIFQVAVSDTSTNFVHKIFSFVISLASDEENQQRRRKQFLLAENSQF